MKSFLLVIDGEQPRIVRGDSPESAARAACAAMRTVGTIALTDLDTYAVYTFHAHREPVVTSWPTSSALEQALRFLAVLRKAELAGEVTITARPLFRERSTRVLTNWLYSSFADIEFYEEKPPFVTFWVLRDPAPAGSDPWAVIDHALAAATDTSAVPASAARG